MSDTFTLIHPEGRAEVAATIEGEDVRLAPETVKQVLGWQLRDEGLCRGDVCVPVQERASLADERGIDLACLAGALGLPIALDAPGRAAAIGVPHSDRSAQLDSLEAPDFSLPDLAGHLHSLSDYRGKKVLLIAYASW